MEIYRVINIEFVGSEESTIMYYIDLSNYGIKIEVDGVYENRRDLKDPDHEFDPERFTQRTSSTVLYKNAERYSSFKDNLNSFWNEPEDAHQRKLDSLDSDPILARNLENKGKAIIKSIFGD